MPNILSGCSVALLVLYTIGIPVALFIIIRRRRDRQFELRRVFGFLTAGFRAHRWWWELWNSLRKAMFTAGAILLRPVGVEMQTWAALAMLIIFWSVFSRYRPYEQKALNQLEVIALATDVWVLLAGLGLFLSQGESGAGFFTALIVFVNVAFLLVWGYNWWRLSKVFARCRKTVPRSTIVAPARKQQLSDFQEHVHTAVHLQRAKVGVEAYDKTAAHLQQKRDQSQTRAHHRLMDRIARSQGRGSMSGGSEGF